MNKKIIAFLYLAFQILILFSQKTITLAEKKEIPQTYSFEAELKKGVLQEMSLFQSYLHDITRDNISWEQKDEIKTNIIDMFVADGTIQTMNLNKNVSEYKIYEYLTNLATRPDIDISFLRDPIVIGEPKKIKDKEYTLRVSMIQLFEKDSNGRYYSDITEKIAHVHVDDDEDEYGRPTLSIKIIKIDAIKIRQY